MRVRKVLEKIPTPEELETVRTYVRKRGLSMVPTNVFRRAASFSLFKAVRPPTKKHLGTKLRSIDPQPTVAGVFEELTSTARGLPVESADEGILRRVTPGFPQRLEGQPLAPVKQTSTRDLYKLKLQRQDCVRALCRFEDTQPKTGLGATRLISKKKTLRKVCMAAGPLTVKANMLKGKAVQERFSTISMKTNVLTMDVTTAEVHFGVMNYEPWLRKWLRWEIYDSIEKMAAHGGTAASLISNELLLMVEEKKADRKWAKEPRWSELD